jgi:hypothetical protein
MDQGRLWAAKLYWCIADGTLLLPLAFQPSTDDYADYKGSKMLYTLTMLVVNDDQRRIRYFSTGWPRSTHNDWVFQNSRIVKELDDHFLENCTYGP